MPIETKDTIHEATMFLDEVTGDFRSAFVRKGRFFHNTDTGELTFAKNLDPETVTQDEAKAIFGDAAVNAMAQHADMKAKLEEGLAAASDHTEACNARLAHIHDEAATAHSVITTATSSVSDVIATLADPVDTEISYFTDCLKVEGLSEDVKAAYEMTIKRLVSMKSATIAGMENVRRIISDGNTTLEKLISHIETDAAA